MLAGYRATQNEDGTWTVLDVPIFAESVFDIDGEDFNLDREWQEGAVSRAQERARFGYLAPLHINHTSDPRGKVAAGFLLPTRVAQFTFSDGMKWTTYANYLRVPDAVFQSMRRGELPYVSIEGKDVRKREISACALMPDTVPHHKFPLFTIGEAVPHGTQARFAVAASDAGSARAFASAGAEFAALSRFTMRKLARKDYDAKAREFVFTFSDGSSERAKNGGAFEFEEPGAEEPKGEKADDAKATMGVKELAAALKGMTLSLAEIGELRAVIEAAAKALEGAGGGEKKPEKPSDNPAEAQMSESHVKAIEAAQASAMEAKAEAAEARSKVAEFQAERAKDAALAAAAKALAGHTVQPGELEATFAEGGAKGLDIYVKARQKHGRKAPLPGNVSTVTDAEFADLPKDFEFSADVALREKQIKASRDYDKASAHTRARMTRKRFIDCNTLSAADLARAESK